MLTLSELAEYLNGVWHGNAEHAIFSFTSLARATPNDLAYFDNPLLSEVLNTTKAGVVLLKAEHQHLYAGNSIIVADPLQAMTKAIQFLSSTKDFIGGIAATASIHPSAQIGKEVSIGPYSVIGEGVRIDDAVIIGANTVIESSVSIGKNTQIANGVIVHAGCRLGANNVLNSGSILGAMPFNYLKSQGHWQQGPAVGGVCLADNVHVGANVVIDRGSLNDTYLAEGVCVDNLVQIAHDVLIGKNTIIVGCAMVGAYVQIGADCVIGGGSCIAAHVHLVDDVVITGMSTVNKSLAKSGIYSSGTLVHEHERWRRNAARFKRLDDYVLKLSAIEKKLVCE